MRGHCPQGPRYGRAEEAQGRRETLRELQGEKEHKLRRQSNLH